MAGLNTTGRLWRFHYPADDDVGGALPSGTILKENVYGRIEQLKATQVLLEQGLELPEMFQAFLYYTGDPLDIQNNDELEIYYPPISPFYNKGFRILGYRHSSHADIRRFVEVTMKRHVISRSNTYQFQGGSPSDDAPIPAPAPPVNNDSNFGGSTGSMPPAVLTYYVASAGSDSADGLTPATAWETLAKVNSLTLTPGTSILFSRGDSWIGTVSLVVPTSGTALNYNYFGAYGTGANPIISRSDANYGIKTNAKSYTTFENLDGVSGTRNYYVYDSPYTIIRNCSVVASVADEGCIVIEGSGAGTSHHISIINVTSDAQPGWAISVGSGINVQQDSIEIRGCTITNIAGGGAVQHHGIYIKNCTNMDVQGNTITDPDRGAIKLVQDAGKTVSGRIRRNNLSGYGAGGSGAGISLDGITGSLIIDNNLIHDGLYNAGIYSLSASDNIKVYNNTIVRNYYGIELLTGSAGWIVKNNIIVQDAAWLASSFRSCIKFEDETDIANNTFDNNLYYHKNGAGTYDPLRKDNGGPISLSAWQGLAGAPDQHSLSVDSKFVIAYTNLHIQTTSTAKDAGVDVVGISVDYDGTTLASPPDVGALQFV